MITIQLDVKALQYLIEQGGEEFQVALRSAVLQAAASKFVKAAVDKVSKAALQDMVNEAVSCEVGGVSARYPYNVQIAEPLKKRLSDEVDKTVRAMKIKVMDELDASVRAKVDRFSADLEARVDLVMKQRLKAKLEAQIAKAEEKL